MEKSNNKKNNWSGFYLQVKTRKNNFHFKIKPKNYHIGFLGSYGNCQALTDVRFKKKNSSTFVLFCRFSSRGWGGNLVGCLRLDSGFIFIILFSGIFIFYFLLLLLLLLFFVGKPQHRLKFCCSALLCFRNEIFVISLKFQEQFKNYIERIYFLPWYYL